MKFLYSSLAAIAVTVSAQESETLKAPQRFNKIVENSNTEEAKSAKDHVKLGDELGRAIVQMIGEEGFERINGYGCWCYFDDLHGKGKSQPVNEVDSFCKSLHEGYDCAIIDADNEGDIEACVPWEVPYTAASIGDSDAIVDECNARNDDNCARRACMIETQFVTSMFRFTISGGQMDDTPMHSNGFDVAENCPTHQGSPSEKDCCGAYPYRHPYKTYGGQRNCCGMKTYDVTVLNCCPSGKVRVNC